MRRVLRFLASLFKWSVLVAAFVGGALAVAVLSTWWTVQRHFDDSEAVVPELMGLSVEEAEARLARADLTLRIEARRPHDAVEPGRVFFQHPHPAARTRRKRQVRVIVSSGPQRREVPTLVAGSGRAALLQLAREGFSPGQVHRVHSSETSGSEVLAQEPPPGSRVGEEVRVDLLISNGPRRLAWVLPDFSGRTLPEVEATLARGGLRLAEVRQESVPGVPGGHVHSQAPPAGSRVTTESAISVVVARVVETPTADAFPSLPRYHER